MDNKVFITYKDSSIMFRKDKDGDIHGVHYTYENGVDDREDFYVYESEGKCITDYVIQGIYVGSLITNNIHNLFETLDKDEDWESNLVQLKR